MKYFLEKDFLSIDCLPSNAQDWVTGYMEKCDAKALHICDGTDAENEMLIKNMLEDGMLKKLTKLENCYLARTDPRDTARVETKTVICTEKAVEAVPTPKEGVAGNLGVWMSKSDLEKFCDENVPGCMRGRAMYVIPFSMGPIGSKFSKIGLQITDSPYVVASMRIMTRMGKAVIDELNKHAEVSDDKTTFVKFVKGFHSVGCPLPLTNELVSHWPCNIEHEIIAQIPDSYEIRSFGSGYGGNSLLGKKCFALRIGSVLGRDEGWLAEHMLIMGVTNPKGVKKYVVAAFPSCCGKTNLAMMKPSLPGYKIECVGDDIAWMRFDDTGRLRAINPEAGFFGVAPGTSNKTNPNAMETIFKNTIFTNVAETVDGAEPWWEGLPLPDGDATKLIDWRGNDWTPASENKAAHPNSRFCTPASQCPIMDPEWESPDGVPIDAIIFGGRRPTGVPLVYEAFNWDHGVFTGATMRSEITAAASDSTGQKIRHDPFAMRPFFGYNFGAYLAHWISMKKEGRRMPKIFHVNWFRTDAESGKFLWPGFGENIRVLDWICRRTHADDQTPAKAEETFLGYLPAKSDFDLDDNTLSIDWDKLFELDPKYWLAELEEISEFFATQLPHDLPPQIAEQFQQFKTRVEKFCAGTSFKMDTKSTDEAISRDEGEPVAKKAAVEI